MQVGVEQRCAELLCVPGSSLLGSDLGLFCLIFFSKFHYQTQHGPQCSALLVLHQKLGTTWPIFLLLPLCTQSEDHSGYPEELDGFPGQVWPLSLGAQGSQVWTEGQLRHGMPGESLAGISRG